MGMAQIFRCTCVLNSEGKKPHSFSSRWKYPSFGMFFDLAAMKHLRPIFKAYVLGKLSSFLDSGSHCASDCKDFWNELLLSEQPDTSTNPHL